MAENQIKVLLAIEGEASFNLVKSQLDPISSFSFLIDRASDYAKIIDLLKRHTYDIYLVDYGLSKVAGLHLLKEALKQSDARVLMLIGPEEKQVNREAFLLGVSDFLLTESLDVNVFERNCQRIRNNDKQQFSTIQSQKEKLGLTSNIAHSIAHDIRNPLTNINMAQGQLADTYKEDGTSEMYLGIIHRNAQKINRLIDALLNASSPPELQLQSHTLNEILDKALSMARDHPNYKNVKIEKHYDEQLPALTLDAEKLTQSFCQILKNALEAIEPHQGTIRITTQQLDQQQSVQISDSGKGIHPEAIHQVFDAFYTDNNGKAGLGLTFAQNITNAHGGHITVTSMPQEGTCFHFVFPSILHQ